MWAVGVLTAGITAYYMFRMLFVTFLGTYRGHVDPSELGLRHPELAGTAPAHPAGADDHGHAHHAPAWLMSGPVALLMIPTVLIGWLDFGGENSAWGQFFAPVFGHFEAPAGILPEALTELCSCSCWSRPASPSRTCVTETRAALLDAVPRLAGRNRAHAQRTDPRVLLRRRDRRAVRAPLDRARPIFRSRDRPAGHRCGRARGEHLRRRGSAISSRSFQTDLVRAYALALAFGYAACFAIYYVVIGAGR